MTTSTSSVSTNESSTATQSVIDFRRITDDFCETLAPPATTFSRKLIGDIKVIPITNPQIADISINIDINLVAHISRIRAAYAEFGDNFAD